MSNTIHWNNPMGSFRGFGIEKSVSRKSKIKKDIRANESDILFLNPSFEKQRSSKKKEVYENGESIDDSGFFDWGRHTPVETPVYGVVDSYSFIKNDDQIIDRVSNITLTIWDDSSLEFYHSIPGWDLSTGVYEALRNEILTLAVNVTWSRGVSNLGERILKIQCLKPEIPGWITIKMMKIQAALSIKQPTVQTCQIHAKLKKGDLVRVSVEHDAPVPLLIEGGESTTICGFSVKTE